MRTMAVAKKSAIKQKLSFVFDRTLPPTDKYCLFSGSDREDITVDINPFLIIE